jgi:hypothetical protein
MEEYIANFKEDLERERSPSSLFLQFWTKVQEVEHFFMLLDVVQCVETKKQELIELYDMLKTQTQILIQIYGNLDLSYRKE